VKKNGSIDQIDDVFEVQKIDRRGNFEDNLCQSMELFDSIAEIGNFQHFESIAITPLFFKLKETGLDWCAIRNTAQSFLKR